MMSYKLSIYWIVALMFIGSLWGWVRDYAGHPSSYRCLQNILAFILYRRWAAPLKLNPDSEQYFSEQVSVSSF